MKSKKELTVVADTTMFVDPVIRKEVVGFCSSGVVAVKGAEDEWDQIFAAAPRKTYIADKNTGKKKLYFAIDLQFTRIYKDFAEDPMLSSPKTKKQIAKSVEKLLKDSGIIPVCSSVKVFGEALFA